MKRLGKIGIETEMLILLIIMAVVLFIAVASYIIFKTKGINAIEFIKNLFRFRG